MPTVPLFLVMIDPSIGRVDKSSLSQHTLLELVFAGVEPKEAIYADASDDVAKWHGVSCNDNGDVIEINFSTNSLRKIHGSIDVQWLPATVVSFLASWNTLSGTIDMEALPHTLQGLEVDQNELTGSLRLRNLPPPLARVYLSYNRFSGEVDLTNLPPKMSVLSVACNALSGPLDLTSLPPNMEKLYIYRNEFSGETDFLQLPQSLRFFNLSGTKLKGVLPNKNKRDFQAKNTAVVIVES